MRVLVVYYSRTGLTKKIATHISMKLRADLDEIIDKKDRSGAVGYMLAGKDAMKESLTQVTFEKNPKEYDMVIIGGPVWAWTVTPAIRTYIDKNIDGLRIKRLAFFATQGSSGSDKKFAVMEKMLGSKPLATLTINGKDFRGEAYVDKVNDFLSSLK